LFVLAAGVALIAGQSPQPPAPQTPTFRADIEYVEVDALVTDQQGAFVRGLTQDDFEVFEDGKRQTIATFSIVDIPVERADRPLFARAPLEPDVFSNERPFDGRVYVMVLDDLHVSFSRTARVKAAARQFIERRLGANDLMAIVFTRGRAQDAQEFTGNKRLLLASVDKFSGAKVQSPGLATQASPTGRDENEQERAYNTRSMLSTLRQVAEWFGGVRGRRKTLLLMSEGSDNDLLDILRGGSAASNPGASLIHDVQDALAAMARSNVSIYAIDPRGLTGVDDNAIADVADVSPDDAAGEGLRSLGRDLRISQDNLRQLAEESGGFAAVNRNDFAKAFDRIVQDNSSYYALAYYPPSVKRDGKLHKIEVKVKRPGLTVRARRGYTAPRG
jgi:VWFA-related protein